MKIVVLAGGNSPERDVSLSSGSLIANALIDNGHQVMLLDLSRGLDNFDIAPVYRDKSSSERFHYTIGQQEPGLASDRQSAAPLPMIGRGVVELCRKADIVFMALHGSIGENGQLQALFDIYGIKYTGTGYIGCMLAMDKDLSKRLMRQSGILTANWQYVQLDDQFDADKLQVNYPCVVKPCSCGSSVGVSLVDTSQQLKTALTSAQRYEQSVLIEDKIVGREFSVGVLNGQALPVIEIKPKSGFYDYTNKYQAGLTDEICPAEITDNIRRKLQEAAVAVHQALRLGFYSRVDFIVDQKDDAYCLEANALPGMTPNSLLPQEAQAAGISHNDLCGMIAQGK